MRAQIIKIGLFLGVFIVFPILATKGWQHILIMALFYMIYSVGLWVIMRMGYVSFGHAAFVGIGAYASAMLTTMVKLPVLIAIPISGLIAAIIGLGMGKITLQLRGIYFSMTIFSFVEVVRALWLAFDRPFGGAMGIMDIPKPAILGMKLSTHLSFYLLLLFFFILIFLFLWSLDKSHFGFTCLAVQTKDNELLAQSIGINTTLYKNVSLGISSLICGLGGALYAHYFSFVSPFVFTVFMSNDLVVFNVVGGTSSIFGPLLGAGLLTIISELMLSAGYYRTLIFGFLMLITILVFPGGLISLFRKKGKP